MARPDIFEGIQHPPHLLEEVRAIVASKSASDQTIAGMPLPRTQMYPLFAQVEADARIRTTQLQHRLYQEAAEIRNTYTGNLETGAQLHKFLFEVLLARKFAQTHGVPIPGISVALAVGNPAYDTFVQFGVASPKQLIRNETDSTQVHQKSRNHVAITFSSPDNSGEPIRLIAGLHNLAFQYQLARGLPTNSIDARALLPIRGLTFEPESQIDTLQRKTLELGKFTDAQRSPLRLNDGAFKRLRAVFITQLVAIWAERRQQGITKDQDPAILVKPIYEPAYMRRSVLSGLQVTIKLAPGSPRKFALPYTTTPQTNQDIHGSIFGSLEKARGFD